MDSGSLKIQYNRNRYYDYYTGRWLTQDPLGIMPNPQRPNRFDVTSQYVDGLSLYEYVGSNPVNRLDPAGSKRGKCTLSLYSIGDSSTQNFLAEIIKKNEYWWAFDLQIHDGLHTFNVYAKWKEKIGCVKCSF